MLKLKNSWIDCECDDSDHAVRFSWFPEDDDRTIYMSVRPNPCKSFWQRLSIGLRYIFGCEKHNMFFYQETILDEAVVKNLIEVLNNFWEGE